MKKLKLESNQVFFNIFGGELMVCYLKQTVTTADEESQSTSNLYIEGYLLDMDDSNYYFGRTSDAVNSFVPIQNVAWGEIANPLASLPDDLILN